METLDLNPQWKYSFTGSLDSKTRCIAYTLVGISNDNREVSSRLLTNVEYYGILSLVELHNNQK